MLRYGFLLRDRCADKVILLPGIAVDIPGAVIALPLQGLIDLLASHVCKAVRVLDIPACDRRSGVAGCDIYIVLTIAQESACIAVLSCRRDVCPGGIVLVIVVGKGTIFIDDGMAAHIAVEKACRCSRRYMSDKTSGILCSLNHSGGCGIGYGDLAAVDAADETTGRAIASDLAQPFPVLLIHCLIRTELVKVTGDKDIGHRCGFTGYAANQRSRRSCF